MGRYTSPIKISGSFNDLTLCKDGTARMKSSLTRKKWKSHPSYAHSRRAAHIFGGASTLANRIYRFLPEEMRKLARSHGHNHIATAIRNAIGGQSPERITFEMVLPALHQLDISAGQSIANQVRIRTLGNPVQPKGIHITGLQEAARALKQQWARQHSTSKHHESSRAHAAPSPGNLQFRIHLTAMDFQDVHWVTDEWKREGCIDCKRIPVGNWIDVDAVPDEGLAFKIASPNTQMPQIAFMGIEWQFNPGPKTPHKDHDLQRYSILKVAALFRPEATLHLPLPDCMAWEGSRRYFPLKTRKATRRPALSAALKFRLSLPLQGTNYDGIRENDWIGYAPELLIPSKRRRNPDRGQHRAVPNKEEMESHGRNSRKQMESDRGNSRKQIIINPKKDPKMDATNPKGTPRASHHPSKTNPTASQDKSALYPHILRTTTAPDSIPIPLRPRSLAIESPPSQGGVNGSSYEQKH